MDEVIVNNIYIAVGGDIKVGFTFYGPYYSWDEARQAHKGEYICIEKLNQGPKRRLEYEINEDYNELAKHFE